ncbi:unnamed protein product, partial [Mesorhabditis belari]|uniref:UEV domain-containing protein n=1 Tax=Mesorhabditis belari TaxID=2138241 RepID=A0AAF3ET33_9BILA
MSAAELKKRLVAAKSQYIELAKQDIVDALNQFRDLVPDLEKFKFPDKDNEQRITFKLKGTIPMCYRETVYNIPISIYLSSMHPYHSPVCYVNPTEDMVIRSNENVSKDGRVYLSYLHEWRYPGYDLTGLIQILAMSFGEKCPVFSKKSGKTASQSTSVNPWPTPTPMVCL